MVVSLLWRRLFRAMEPTTPRASSSRPVPQLHTLLASFLDYPSAEVEGRRMRIWFAIVALSVAVMSSQGKADEHRGGDAALGALSGAVVFGPIGAIAGAAVGYAAGPSIAHSWGFRRSQSARRARPVREATQATDTRPAVQSGPPAPSAPPVKPGPSAQSTPPAPKTASTMPPVQSLE
jgi:hypothetical protein